MLAEGSLVDPLKTCILIFWAFIVFNGKNVKMQKSYFDRSTHNLVKIHNIKGWLYLFDAHQRVQMWKVYRSKSSTILVFPETCLELTFCIENAILTKLNWSTNFNVYEMRIFNITRVLWVKVWSFSPIFYYFAFILRLQLNCFLPGDLFVVDFV